jgi:hypothetical protein
MGLRFRRSIKILPGVRLNLSKSGLGISAGPRGLHVGIDARGRKYASAGIPGTGLSSRQYIGGRRAEAMEERPVPEQSASMSSFGVFALVLMVAGIGMLAMLVLIFK